MSFLANYQGKIIELQRRLTRTGESLISRSNQWRRISTVPPTDCDVVLTFGHGTSEADIQWFLRLLRDRVPELVCHLHNHRTSGQWALYLTACYRDLLLGAEELRIKKPLAAEHGGGLREFSLEELDLFANGTDERCFLSSSERSCIVHHYLLGLCARDGDGCSSTTITFRNGQPLIHPLQSAGFIQQIFPVHEADELRKLKSRWVQGLSFRQPLDDIRRYFGVHIALYFAWLGHYTSALIFPAVVGLLVWFFIDTKTCKFYHLIMAVLSLIWSTVYLEHWKRTSSTLTYQWGEWDTVLALLEEPRTAFKGKLTRCPVTGRLVRTYPTWRRNVIMVFISAPVVLLSLVVVVGITFGFVRFQDQMNVIASDKIESSVFGAFLSLIPKVLLAILILVMDMAYQQLATWLTDFENHRLETEYHNHFVGKLLLLQFMNAFFSPFYIAFYLQDLDMLQQQLTTLLITRQLLGNVREVFLPYGQTRFRQFLLSFQYERYKKSHPPIMSDSDTPSPSTQEDGAQSCISDESTTEVRHRCRLDPTSLHNMNDSDASPISAQEREAALLPYNGTDEDFLEIFIQFGYVSMFSCIFPVAGALAFLNNLVEIRGDAFKLTSSFQRPFARPASNIGIWQLAMTSMGYISVIVNIALLSVSGAIYELLPQMNTTQSILFLVAIEHCIYVLYYTLSSLIPDTPYSVMQQLAALEHRRREALRTLERESMREYKRHRSTSRSKLKESIRADLSADDESTE